MLGHEMKEAKEGCIEIKEAEPETVREMLNFFYTGKVKNMSGVCIKLYGLAHQYLVKDLTAMCLGSMIGIVNLGNALELYTLAKKYDVPQLALKAKEVILG
jgi:hypothetical protein